MLAIHVVAGAVLLFFLVWEMVDAPLDDGAAMLLLLFAIVVGAALAGLGLHKNGHKILSLVVLAPVAWIGGIYGLILLIVIILQPSFR